MRASGECLTAALSSPTALGEAGRVRQLFCLLVALIDGYALETSTPQKSLFPMVFVHTQHVRSLIHEMVQVRYGEYVFAVPLSPAIPCRWKLCCVRCMSYLPLYLADSQMVQMLM